MGGEIILAVVKGIIREIGRSKTTRVSARRWIGSTNVVVQDESTMQTYCVRVSAKTMDKYHFLPRVGMKVVLHGYIEEANYGLCDFFVSRVTKIKHVGAGIKRVIRFSEIDSTSDESDKQEE
jgi:hypothetical protein